MNGPSDFLMFLLMTLVFMGVVSLMLSYTRYRRLELASEQEKATEPAVSPAALVMALLSQLRKQERLLVRVNLPEGADSVEVKEFLSAHTRSGDEHLAVEGGGVVSLVDCPPDQAERLAKRWVALLTSGKMTQGDVQMLEPGMNPDDLYQWVSDATRPVSAPMKYAVSVTDETADDSSTENPAVDPETGVFRLEVVSRVMRRQLAECQRTSRPVVVMRVQSTEAPDPGGLRSVAEALMASCRESDLIGRCGEREFVVCLMTARTSGVPIAERIQKTLSQQGMQTCIGLASMPEDGENPTVLFERAGRALLKAGEDGGESVRMFDMELEPSEQSDAREPFGKEIF